MTTETFPRRTVVATFVRNEFDGRRTYAHRYARLDCGHEHFIGGKTPKSAACRDCYWTPARRIASHQREIAKLEAMMAERVGTPDEEMNRHTAKVVARYQAEIAEFETKAEVA